MTVWGAPTGGLRRYPQRSKAVRPHVVLLADYSMIGSTASDRNVSLLKRMARPPSSEYVLNWSEMCGTCSGGLLEQGSVKGAAHGCDQL